METEELHSDREQVTRTDQYGFERPTGSGSDSEPLREQVSNYEAVLRRRAIKWRKLLQGSRVERSLRMKRYIRKGIPNEYRSLIWMTVSGAQTQMEKNPAYYKKLLEMEEDPRLVDAVKTVTKDEEKSFWLLDALIGKIVPDFYTPTMIGLKTDQEVLSQLVKVKVPAVAALMEKHNVMWTLVVGRWFICLFIDVLPVETVLRIWDCLFYEGSKITFRVALTLIKYHQASILEANSFAAICEKFKEIARGSLVQDCHVFMQKIFSEPGRLPLVTITKLRKCSRAEIDAQS
ncbi:growth hormone-regulated TBC protein 1-like isoform X2 [Heterodontus francisci]|uniref:growth hormone-regulated TBC protein 1-like isoform X2 n=1 Tax=Heterodontus francisci TaxID=7792 RepID=UPI00355B892A